MTIPRSPVPRGVAQPQAAGCSHSAAIRAAVLLMVVRPAFLQLSTIQACRPRSNRLPRRHRRAGTAVAGWSRGSSSLGFAGERLRGQRRPEPAVQRHAVTGAAVLVQQDSMQFLAARSADGVRQLRQAGSGPPAAAQVAVYAYRSAALASIRRADAESRSARATTPPMISRAGGFDLPLAARCLQLADGRDEAALLAAWCRVR